jgi:ribosomal protein S18 acetylase RimI-like enzyme
VGAPEHESPTGAQWIKVDYSGLQSRKGTVPAMKYELRPATPHDYAFLYDLHVATMKPYVTQVWGWDEQLQADRFRQYFDPTRQRIVVADGRQIGVLEVEERPSELFLANLRILPPFQGQGWGTRILGDLLQQGRSAGAPLTLQVLKVNSGARRLYERLGLRVIQETPTHYQMSAPPGKPPTGSG